MEPVTSARGLAETDSREEAKQRKAKLTYSTTSGISQEGPAPEALIVCIIQVVTRLLTSVKTLGVVTNARKNVSRSLLKSWKSSIVYF
jgi:hypothetical protein